ncbi:CU044_5270 family protein [Allorhizocola rhizosphaerae]|uniref:CU044_5270 family protein n=1 Tax=Allorhizocola rhizosphaerae TaxID=1872709 RepID=UPI0013C2ADE0|nr:CU044_5270 family protein [Allorhizocola rhizosphaerae]
MSRVLRRLAEARPAQLDQPAPKPLDLDTITVVPMESARRPSPARRRVALAATAFTAVASMIAVGNLVPGDGRQSPIAGRQSLLVAAQLASAQSEPMGAYWVSRSEQGTRYAVTGGYNVFGRTDQHSWMPLTAEGGNAYCVQWLGAAPVTDADREAWQRAGSPATWAASGPGGEPTPGRTLTAQPGEKGCKRLPDRGPGVNVGGTTLTLDQLRALPTDPDQLAELLLRNETDARGTWQPDDLAEHQTEMLFIAATDLLLRLPSSGAVRSAAYLMLADLPGITYLGEVTDPLGRRGSAVEHTFRSADGSSQRHRLVIDVVTGQTMASEIRDGQSGALISCTAVTESTYSDQAPAT